MINNKVFTLSINGHYLERNITGLSRYAIELKNTLTSMGYEFLIIKPPFFRSRGKGIFSRMFRFVALFFTELFLPYINLCLYGAKLHISPAYASSLPILSKKFIVVIHDLAFIEFPCCYSWIEKIYYKFNLMLLKINNNHILTPSQYVKDEIISILKIRPSRISIIPPETSISQVKISSPPLNYK
jgi:hypothetical protein